MDRGDGREESRRAEESKRDEGNATAAAPVRSAPKKLSEIMSEEIGSLTHG